MIQLWGYLHRTALCEIVRRWLMDELEPDDPVAIKEIVNFNALVTRAAVASFADEICRDVYGVEPRMTSIRTKGELKDFIVTNPTVQSARVDELIRAYWEHPEDYYRETPINGRLFYVDVGDQQLFLGAARMKRYRRIAEKAGRRVADLIFSRARERLAAQQPVDGDPNLSGAGPGPLIAELDGVEAQLRRGLRARDLSLNGIRLDINDVVGMKLVGDDDTREAVVRYVQESRHTTLLEREEHRGTFNATNLTVDLRLDKEAILATPFGAVEREMLAMRGLPRHGMEAALQRFVTTGEDSLRVEIILSDYAELLESEIGRCMHEPRIQRQRDNPLYRRALATNAQYLLTYLFAFAISPETRISQLPIQLWGRYIPDYVDQVLRQLFHVYDFTLNF